MIPKKIHYCWFGHNTLTDLAVKCIASWKKYLPDYEIIEWNETNCDLESCRYVKEAYEAKKWAFVSDFVRFDVLYQYGGLYFDTDVEVIKPLDDLISEGAFMGCEQLSGNAKVAPGLGLAATPGLILYKEILENYQRSSYINEDGTINQATVVTRITNILVEKGFDCSSNQVQKIGQINIYPI